MQVSYVAWTIECSINDRDGLDSVMGDLVSAVEANEQATTHYEWNISDDGATVITHERFADTDAALAHIGGFGPFAERFMAALTVNKMTVYGAPSDELKEAIAGFSPTFMSEIGGFAR